MSKLYAIVATTKEKKEWKRTPSWKSRTCSAA